MRRICKKTDIRGAKGLTQKQFEQIIYEQGKPPLNIPDELTLPKDRAYIVGEDGKRYFVKSDKPWSEQLIDG